MKQNIGNILESNALGNNINGRDNIIANSDSSSHNISKYTAEHKTTNWIIAILCITSIIISILALSISNYRVNNVDLSFDSHGFYGWVVASMSLIIAILIGWNIYKAIEVDEKIHNLENRIRNSIDDEIKKINNDVSSGLDKVKNDSRVYIIQQSLLIETEILKSFLFDKNYNMSIEIGAKIVEDSSDIKNEDALNGVSDILMDVINKLIADNSLTAIELYSVKNLLSKLENSKINTKKSIELILLIEKNTEKFNKIGM